MVRYQEASNSWKKLLPTIDERTELYLLSELSEDWSPKGGGASQRDAAIARSGAQKQEKLLSFCPPISHWLNPIRRQSARDPK